jgi:hypothetical protein
MNSSKLKIFRPLCLLFVLGSLAVHPSFGFAGSGAREKAKPRAATSFQGTLDPATVNFPPQAVGTPSLPVTITLSDYTSTSAVISSIATSGDFSQTNTCGTGTSGGGQCYIFVTFTPTALGSRVGTLTVTDNASNSPETVALSGFAAPTGIGSTSTVAASSGSTGAYTLTGTLIGTRGSGSPTGTIAFLDTTNSGISLGQAALGSGIPGLSLATGPSVLSGIESTKEVVADFNGDGKLDLAVFVCTDPQCPSPTVSVYLGKGNGTFTQSASFVPQGDLVVGDFNGDGKPDIAAGASGSSYLVEFGNGDGTFTAKSVALTTTISGCYASGNFNGDGYADLLCLDSNTATILLGQQNETFISAAGNPFSAGDAYSALIGDFNGDGKTDFAVLGSPSTFDLSVEVSLGNGDGTFQAPVSTDIGNQVSPSDSYDSFAVGDINADGKTDLAIEGGVTKGAAVSDGFMALLSKGDGTFTPGPAIPITPSPTYNGQTYSSNSGGIAVQDFNGDGKADVAVLNDVVAQVYLSNGDGTFIVGDSADSGAETDPDWESVVIGDFNGDGFPDLAGLNSDAGDATVYFTEHTETAVATFANVTVPGTGSHNVTAVYAGNANFGASTSSPIALSASPVVTALSVTSSAASFPAGTQVTLTATVKPYSFDSLVTNTEKVTFSSNGASIGTGTLSSGVATLNISSLPVGTDSIIATYAGDSNFAPATSSAISVIVSGAVPVATVSPASLTFAAQTLGSTSTSQAVTLANSSVAALAITSIAASGDFAQTNNCGASLAGGSSCTISVTFTPTVAGARSGSLTIADNANGSAQTVGLAGGGASIALSAGSNSLTIASPGATATTPIQLSAVDGFTGSVNLTCAVTYQGQGSPTDQPTCSLDPAQMQISQGTPAPSTLTLSSTATTSSQINDGPFSTAGIVFATMVCIGFMPRRSMLAGTRLVLLGAVLMGGMLGCGGSGSTASKPNPGTTTGSYQVVVTGTSGKAVATTAISLNMQ